MGMKSLTSSCNPFGKQRSSFLGIIKPASSPIPRDADAAQLTQGNLLHVTKQLSPPSPTQYAIENLEIGLFGLPRGGCCKKEHEEDSKNKTGCSCFGQGEGHHMNRWGRSGQRSALPQRTVGWILPEAEGLLWY